MHVGFGAVLGQSTIKLLLHTTEELPTHDGVPVIGVDDPEDEEEPSHSQYVLVAHSLCVVGHVSEMPDSKHD